MSIKVSLSNISINPINPNGTYFNIHQSGIYLLEPRQTVKYVAAGVGAKITADVAVNWADTFAPVNFTFPPGHGFREINYGLLSLQL